ncbi:MAG: hypothetical protein QOD82_1455, partial [Pseudonocardiales bacterium]|nr:hypothetical protein [Pseudonocardiales bacterium]
MIDRPPPSWLGWAGEAGVIDCWVAWCWYRSAVGMRLRCSQSVTGRLNQAADLRAGCVEVNVSLVLSENYR